MAEDLVVVEEMRKSAGLRVAGQSAGQLYGPGKNILVPRALAEALQLKFKEAVRDEDGNVLNPQPEAKKADETAPPAGGGAAKAKKTAAAPAPWSPNAGPDAAGQPTS
jgi:hypothetical protein